MPETHQLSPRIFWHGMRTHKAAPIIDTGFTQEVEPPFRHATSRVFRVPLTPFAVAIGRWSTITSKEGPSLMRAIGGRELGDDLEEVREWG
jgi:hypothetical protein